MLSPSQLSRAFARNAAYLTDAVEGIDHEASLAQPPAAPNCLNWTVGHIIHYRNLILGMLDRPPVGSEGELVRYERESKPITGEGPGVLGFARLMALIGESQGSIDGGLSAATAEYMDEVHQVGERTTTRGSRVFFFYFHDTLHLGQADVLAELVRRTET